MRTIVIELLRFDKDGKTCARCEDTAQAVRKVIAKMSALLGNSGTTLEFREVPLSAEQIDESNSVRVNGRDLTEILRETESEMTDCPSCSELIGTETCCRSFIYRGHRHDSITEEMLREGILCVFAPPLPLALRRTRTSNPCAAALACAGSVPNPG